MSLPAMANSNTSRWVESLLARTQSLPPSFAVHLHPEHWLINNSSKFLYHNPTAVRSFSVHINSPHNFPTVHPRRYLCTPYSGRLS